MNDLISREGLINKAEHEAEAMQEPFKSQLPVLVAWLAEKIPSAQPEPLVKESRTLVKDLVKDAISRQAAIVQLSHNKTGDDDCDVVIQNDIETIKALPSVEPEQPSEIQDILDYLDTALHPIISPEHWNVYSELHDMISTLPSAEPEIVTCKECKHRGEEPIADGRYWCEVHNTFMYYCSDAERRTDE
jgi:hypothetical protein